MLYSDKILIFLQQDAEVAKYAHQYNIGFLPAVFCYG